MKAPLTLSVGGVTPLSTVDYPDHLAAVIFCQGCSWRCFYCHNDHLLAHNKKPQVAWGDVLRFLRSRVGLLDAVVFSGGEPTFQKALEPAICEVKEMGFKVALHTSGVNPEVLEKVLPHLDWVGLDVKTVFDDDQYTKVTSVRGSMHKAEQSLSLLLKSGVLFECRTTYHPGWHSEGLLVDLAKDLSSRGVKQYALQKCRSSLMLNQSLEKEAIDANNTIDDQGLKSLGSYFENFSLRI